MQRDPDKHIKKLGKALDKLDDRAERAVRLIYEAEKYGLLGDMLVSYANKVYEEAYGAAQEEIRDARSILTSSGRSYALPQTGLDPVDPSAFRMSDYYRTYLVELAGIVHQETLQKANMSLEKSEQAGEGVNQAAKRLEDVLPQLAVPRLKTIVRTEGTRVASAARRDLALRAAQAGLGPHWLIYTAIMDDRVTHTCSVAHNHKRPVDSSSPLWLEIPPPAHYNCRSMERYGFSWIAEDRAVPDWDEAALAEFRAARLAEFPHWSPRSLPPPKENLFSVAI